MIKSLDGYVWAIPVTRQFYTRNHENDNTSNNSKKGFEKLRE